MFFRNIGISKHDHTVSEPVKRECELCLHFICSYEGNRLWEIYPQIFRGLPSKYKAEDRVIYVMECSNCKNRKGDTSASDKQGTTVLTSRQSPQAGVEPRECTRQACLSSWAARSWQQISWLPSQLYHGSAWTTSTIKSFCIRHLSRAHGHGVHQTGGQNENTCSVGLI